MLCLMYMYCHIFHVCLNKNQMHSILAECTKIKKKFLPVQTVLCFVSP